MEERKFIKLKKEEFGIEEFIKRDLGKGKISHLDIEYTPVGEKITVHTNRPGLVIGKKGEKISELTNFLRKRFKFENPHIEIGVIENPLFDAQLVADDIALALERLGNLKFKVISYKKLQEIMRAGALGCEIRLTGKLPSDRARSWRFAEGYLKKAGESRKEINRAFSTALTKTGIIGIKVAIMPPKARIYDKIEINEETRIKLNQPSEKETGEVNSKKTKTAPKETSDEPQNKSSTKESNQSNEIISKENQESEQKEVLKQTKEELGTAMKIEEELEEGVPDEQIEKDLKENNKEEKENGNS